MLRDGVRTTGVVRDISGRVRRARIDVAYDAGGTPQRGHFFWNDRLRWDVGDPITLYYATDEPSRMTVPGGESDSEPSYWLNIILAVGLIAGLLLGTVNSVQRRRRKLAIARVRYATGCPSPDGYERVSAVCMTRVNAVPQFARTGSASRVHPVLVPCWDEQTDRGAAARRHR